MNSKHFYEQLEVDDIALAKEANSLIEDIQRNIGDVELLIFDPITDFLRTGETNKESDVRSLFKALDKITIALNCGALLISHWRKAEADRKNNMVLGSKVWTLKPRYVWHTTRLGEEDSFELVPGKYKKRLPSIRYKAVGKDVVAPNGAIREGEENVGVVEWLGVGDKVANETGVVRGKAKPKAVKCAEGIFEEHGSYLANSFIVSKIAEDCGVSRSTARRAVEKRATKQVADDGRVFWKRNQ